MTERPHAAERRRKLRRGDRLLLLAVLVSLLVHLLLLVLAAYLPKSAPPEVALTAPPVQIRFVDQPDTEPVEKPPETETVAQRDAQAESPIVTPEPPEDRSPRSIGESPIQEPPRPKPQPQREQETTQPPPEAVEPAPRDEAPSESAPAQPDARARMQDVLRDLRRSPPSWVEAAENAPDLPRGAFGGDSLQFESKADIDWGPYAARIKRIVRSNWRIPVAAQSGVDGIVQVHFYIRRDGGIDELEVQMPSGTVPLDIAARDAIALSDALPPPPIPANLDEERVGATWSFLYNVDDRQWNEFLRQQRLRERRERRAAP